MTAKHYAALGGLLVSLSVIIGGLHDFSDVLTPSFMAGVLGVIGSHLIAMFSDKPGA